MKVVLKKTALDKLNVIIGDIYRRDIKDKIDYISVTPDEYHGIIRDCYLYSGQLQSSKDLLYKGFKVVPQDEKYTGGTEVEYI